jgi:hypothetical protein
MLSLAMAVAVLLVAPGAEVGNGQQAATTPKSAPNEAQEPTRIARAGSTKADLGVAGQVPVEANATIGESTRSTRVYDVSDLLERLAADCAVTKDAAPKRLENMLACYETEPAPPAGNPKPTAVPTPSPALPHVIAKRDGEFSLLHGQFTATTSETNHQRISNQLAR